MLERFEFVEKVGQGGMAVVNRAFIYSGYGFKKEVVVKKILKKHFGNKRYIEMFVDEATLSALLNHSNIVQVFDFFEENDEFYIVMEYIDGGTLRDLIVAVEDENGYIPLQHTLFIIKNILEGMDYYHNKRDSTGRPLGIIHRDLTPKNVLVSIYGDVKISDFGIAKFEDQKDVTVFGEVKGKPSYLSPEQIKLLPNQDHRIDLFVLGIIFYELLTNRHPFKDQNSYITQKNISEGKYKKANTIRKVPTEIEKILGKLLTVDKNLRYQHARDVQKDLMSLNHKISNRLKFSSFVAEKLKPESVDYINSIAPDINSQSDDFREHHRKTAKKKKIFLIAISSIIFINLMIAIFAYINTDKKIRNMEIKKSQRAERLLYVDIDKESVNADDLLKEIKKNDLEKDNDTTNKKSNTLTNRKVNYSKKNLKDATITILVNPYGNIYIDNILVSKVSLINHKIKSGSHKIKIENKSLNKFIEKVIYIDKGKLKHLKFDLKKNEY